MSYPDSVRYLYALGNELKAGAKFGLERMRTVLAELGHPELAGRVVHVAGTNGKGSTCAMVESIARSAGLRTGLNTSPHLIQPTERIQIDGKPVSEAEFAHAFDVVHAAAEALIESQAIDAHPSYFETVTAMAFLIFREKGCELNVVEVGLGGRLDATNVVSPEVTVITPVSFDHEAFLGNTLASIAAEKAGILKPGVPLVLAQQQPEAEAVILQRAADLHCPVHHVSSEQRWTTALRGHHQVQNANTAAVAAQVLGIGLDAIVEGLQTVSWPGRLEYVWYKPNLVLDGAHNPAGAAALAAYIKECCTRAPVWVVYGAMRDKAIDEVAATLFPLADHLIVTAPDFPRALRPEAILGANPHPSAVIARSVAEACELARRAPESATVFFTGSLYLVGEVRLYLLGHS